ncbi:urea carboxylase-associated protein 1 [Plautia stali symbiont]|nr:urea carboxylase-associated protein 1 [Plautia stali symbiont]
MIKESERNPAQARLQQQIDAGDYWLQRIAAGETLRITDLEGNQAADTLFFNADDTAERYSMSEMLRGQHNVFITAGSVLRSSLDRPMLTITADTCGRHDTLCGACSCESNTVRYDLEKRHMHSCRDSWMLAVAAHPESGADALRYHAQH